MIELWHELSRSTLLTVVVCLTRMTAASLVVPFLGGEMVQIPVRVSILSSIGIVLYPMISPTIPHDLPPPLILAGLFLKEALLGFLLGFLAAKLFWVALGIGMVVDNQRGATIAESLDPSSNEQVAPMGQFFQQTLIALFYAGGGFLVFLTAMFESYVAWPVFTFYPRFGEAFPAFFLGQLDEIMRLTVVLAAPLLITLFISEFGLGLINRFAPQLNVFFLAMPVKSLVALIVLIFYFPYLVDCFVHESAESAHILDWLRKVVL